MLFSCWWIYHEWSNYRPTGVDQNLLYLYFLDAHELTSIFQDFPALSIHLGVKTRELRGLRRVRWPLVRWVIRSSYPRKMLEKTIRRPQPQLGNPRTKCEHTNGCSNVKIIIYKLRFRWENDLEMQALMGHAMIYICGSVTASISYSSYVWGHRRQPRNMLVYLAFMGYTGDMSWYMQIYDSHDVGMFDNLGEKETNIWHFEPHVFDCSVSQFWWRWTPFGIPQQLVSSLRLSMSCCFSPCPVSLLAVGRPPGVPISWTVFLVTPLALWIG